jgi:hypothetical protein
VYENTNGKQIGVINIKGPNSTAYATILVNILNSTDIKTAMGKHTYLYP